MKRTHAGFSLIEVMIATTLSLFILTGVLVIFSGSSRSYHNDERTSRLNDELRLGMAQLTEDLEMAGFWTEVQSPSTFRVECSVFGDSVGTNDSTTGCPTSGGNTPGGATPSQAIRALRWAFFDRSSLAILDNTVDTSSTIVSPSTSTPLSDLGFVAGEAQVNSDMIAIKRLEGGSAASQTLNRIYGRSNGSAGTLYRVASTPPYTPAPNPSPTTTDWDYRLSVYYVRTYAVTAGDGIPTLCRKFIKTANPPTIDTECFSLGIEQLQVEVGIDTSTNSTCGTSGTAPSIQYISNPTATQLGQVCSVRVNVLGRSQDPDQMYHNGSRTYQVANYAYTPTTDDHYYREIESSVVLVRNPTTLR